MSTPVVLTVNLQQISLNKDFKRIYYVSTYLYNIFFRYILTENRLQTSDTDYDLGI